jgi:hypothetical protein
MGGKTMKHRKTMTAIIALLLVVGGTQLASADPLVLQGNSINQRNIGNTNAVMTANAISNSTLRNAAAGNTFNATGNLALIVSNNIIQKNIGNSTAALIASNINNSTVENRASGNNISLF